jgi:6-phospho-beta-glucosidase
VADSLGVHPIVQQPLPSAAAGVLAGRYGWVEATVEAAREGSRAKFITALILDGAVGSPDQAACLADELLAAQRAYLPQFKGERAI